MKLSPTGFDGLLIPPERYIEELTAFQAWTDIARSHEGNPVMTRAHVMTELSVAFVWLRDSVMKPTVIAPSCRPAGRAKVVARQFRA
jgi:hypothetical protein